MSDPLLLTKLQVPPPRPALVIRSRLRERLDQGLQPGRKLLLLSAPPGYGKTTLVGDWIQASREPEAAPGGAVARFCWLSLDEDDNELARFFRYFIAALQTAEEGLGERCISLLQAPQLPPFQNIVTLLVNDLALSPQQTPLTMVLDDYHRIRNRQIHQALAFLLDKSPAHFQLALTTRSDPPLSLAQMRVRGEMVEIREADLRFTVADTTAFLNRLPDVNLSPAQIETLAARTEGWIAALQLAAVTLNGLDGRQQKAFVREFGGSHRHVVDYLMDEIWQRQAEDIKEFLLATSLLEQFTASLCAAVTGRDDSREIVADLHRRNLFLVPLDNRRQWYRYHRLFADMLRARADDLDDERLRQLHLRATRWHEQQQLLPQAVHHALAAGNLEVASSLIGQAAGAALREGNLAAIQKWLDALPAAHVRTHPQLALAQAWVAYLGGRMHVAEEYLVAAQAAWPADAETGEEVSLLSLRAFLDLMWGKIPTGTELAQEALALATDADRGLRALILFNLMQVQAANGQIAEATETGYRATRVDVDPENVFLAANIQHALLELLLLRGKLGEVLRRGTEVTGRLVDKQGQPLPVAGPLFVAMGQAAFERGEVERAEGLISHGITLSRQMAAPVHVIQGRLRLVPVKQAQGEGEEALATLVELRQPSAIPYLPLRVEALAAELKLREGQVAAALAWAEKAGIPSLESPKLQLEPVYLVYARCLLADQQWAQADILLAKLAGAAREQERAGSLVPILVVQALGKHAQGRRALAVEKLREAVQIAAPEAHRRPFLEALPHFLPLLQSIRTVAPEFLADLLRRGGLTGRPDAAALLPDPLNEREMEILRLIAAGNSNPEIARELYLSVNTVKWYVKGIFQKLDVSGRKQAAAHARDLGLLS